jgi:hypothetical protein
MSPGANHERRPGNTVVVRIAAIEMPSAEQFGKR